jgi:hypothetical protein
MPEPLLLEGAVEISWAARARKLLRSTWSSVSVAAAKSPIIATLLVAWSVLPEGVQTIILDQIQKALGETFNTLDDLIDRLVGDEDAQQIVADVVNSATKSPTGLVDNVPAELRARIPERMVTVLAQRWKQKNAEMDSRAPLMLKDDATDLRLSLDVVQLVQRSFGVRGSTNTLALHSALRAFVQMPSKDVEEALLLQEN